MKKQRKYIDWEDVILGIGDQEILLKYHIFVSKHSGMSLSRCAYNVLKSHFSKDALDYYREFGRFPYEER